MLAAGCGQEGGPAPYVPPDGSGIINPNGDSGGGSCTKPVVDPLPATTCASSLPITGTGMPGATILVKGGLENNHTTAHTTTGRYCVDVKLYQNNLNTLSVMAQTAGCISSATTVTTTHKTCSGTGGTDPPPEKSKNVSIGAKVTSSDTPDTGLLTALTDGNSTTSATFSGGWASAGAGIWVVVDLGKLVEVDKVVLQWIYNSNSSDKYYAMEYTLLTAGSGTPGDPSTSNPYWTTVAAVTSGTGGTNTHSVTTGSSLVQYVAIIMDQDGASWTWTESFTLGEIEVWDVPKKTTTPPGPTIKTCSNLGS